MFKSVFIVGFYTLISRILGFVRDIFIASYLGSTIVADAFFVAFRIPNYFRRIFAEGAFSAAFIPVFTGLINKPKNNREIMQFIEHTMSLLFFALICISIFFYFAMPLVIAILAPGFVDNKEVYDLTIHFGKIVFPYLLFIALVAQFSSITNSYNRFAFGAFAPALLNISFIGSLLFFTPFVSTPGHALSYGVLIGGAAQFAIMYYAIYKLQITPFIVLPKFDSNIKKFLKLFFPGILGAGAIQLNIIIGTIIASFLPTGAISHLYYADRITQLPLAIFGTALGVALLPRLSKYIQQGENDSKIFYTLNRSVEFSILISFPAVVGLFIFAEPIINILFEHGAFTSVDTYYTSLALVFFSTGLPAYILIKIFNPIFFSREDTKTPLYITIVCLIVNVIISLLLIKYYREIGIAIATSISSWLNALILYVVLRTKKQISIDNRCKKNIIKITCAAIFMLLICFLLRNATIAELMDSSFLVKVVYLMLNILIAIVVFTVLVFMLKIYSVQNIKHFLRKE